MMLRNDHPGSCSSQPHRLNLLLSHAPARGGHSHASPFQHLPRLLEPMGVRTIETTSGEEAADVIQQFTIHMAVIDFSVPLSRAASAPSTSGGPRILQLLRRLEQPPPTILVRPPIPSAREQSRILNDALREGAFAVLDRPLHLEMMLETMRRILRRHYADCWPQPSNPPGSNPGPDPRTLA